MKILLGAIITVFTFSVFANEHKWNKKIDNMSFTEAKAMMQEKVAYKSAMMEEYRNCINNAQDKNALKNCKEEKMEDKRAMKKEMKDKYKKQSQEAVEE